MDIVWSRFFKSLYRRQSVVGFVVTVGLVDAAIGGFTEHWSLLAIGLGTVSVAIAFRWWQLHHRREIVEQQRAPIYILPPQSSQPSLPRLSVAKKHPPRQT
jgi:protein-S-isoprenylcysteine O-methyltransferase Ste14